MNAIQLLLLAVLLYAAGAIAALLFNRGGGAARILGGIAGLLGSAAGLAAAVMAALGGTAEWSLASPFPFGDLLLRLDGLSAFLVGLISVLAFTVSLYSFSSTRTYDDRNPGVLAFCTLLFIALMLLVVTAANAFYFLVFWEMMTLASYFLVTFDGRKKEAVRAGYLYMLVAHAGGALIMLAFFVFYLASGSFEFDAFRQAQLSPALRSLIFLLAFVGFGAKAGMVPLHIWMPGAYASAPTHATALMSSVMKKTAIYGILRFCIELLGVPALWWGVLVLIFGALSAFFGVLFALRERDLKRLLAYSSVENVGIILLGLGAGMIGLSAGQPLVALLGFLAALYHLLNHSFFKALLFLGAGAAEQRAGTSNLNEMGGLGRRMPWTGVTFLVGALSLSAIPPLNGFVSEWFTYQAFFAASGGPTFLVRVLMPLCAVTLALVGALAVMVSIKAYGGAFSGPARNAGSASAKEAPGPMVAAMVLLAAGCALLGLGAPLIAPYLTQLAGGLGNLPVLTVAGGWWVFPLEGGQTLLSTPLTAILLLGLLTVPLIVVAVYGGYKAGRRKVADPWSCGYGYAPSMSVTAGSFDQAIVNTFSSLYDLRALVRKPLLAISEWAVRARDAILQAEPVLERLVKQPAIRAVEYLGQRIQIMQMGDIRLYCLYIILTLAILLVVIFR